MFDVLQLRFSLLVALLVSDKLTETYSMNSFYNAVFQLTEMRESVSTHGILDKNKCSRKYSYIILESINKQSIFIV